MSVSPIKPTHKAIQAYYDALQVYGTQDISHETAVRSAFQNLLATTGHEKKWTLIPELSLKLGGKQVRPDGTLRDEWHLPRGYWEAKDTDDDLDAEIRKKAAKGYPLSNTIFEDTRNAVLYQNGSETFRIPLSDRGKLADLLNAFYSHTIPEFEGFNEAVAAFKERIPDLARGLTEKIALAHNKNKKFIDAFAAFMDLCKTSLNPNIRVEAVDEMLVQHLLTERLFRTIFKNADFTRRNVIAAEIETVIDALASGSFSRAEFLKSLDPFYLAIEGAAATIDDFSQKQHFLNTVYERFFQGYSVKIADTHGIVYTPQEIVDFMCASVEEVLKAEFGKGLGDEGVTFLDPCTGTGNFIVNLMRRIPKKDLRRVYREQLFANEVMLLPYYIASMNIEHEYYELTGEYEPFEGLCFVDTLDLAENKQNGFSFMTPKNTARVKRQRDASITVVIGNPPYNIGQLDENDNNKNRKYPVIEACVRETYSKSSTATNKNALSDAYVKFFRWSVDRLRGRDGIVCMVTNNSFLDQVAFDGMREHLLRDFTRVDHIDLRGNVRHSPKLSGTSYNVFGIQVGVGITVAIRKASQKKRRLRIHRLPLEWRKEKKLEWLGKAAGDIQHLPSKVIKWKIVNPDSLNNWLVPEHAEEFGLGLSLGSRVAKSGESRDAETVFKTYSSGVKTNRDDFVYDFERNPLLSRIESFVENYNLEVDRYKRAKSKSKTSIDDFVKYDQIKWSESLKNHLMRGKYIEADEAQVRDSVYRPFTKKFLYFDAALVERRYLFPRIHPTVVNERNLHICVPGPGNRKGFGCFVADSVISLDFAYEKVQCFPFYVYDEDGTNRRENITDWALTRFREHYKNKKITKWDIFHYVYGVLHQPEYRTTFADNLKRELPRIPFMADFEAFAGAGRQLAKCHLEYESVDPWPLQWVETPGVPLSYEVTKMKLSKDKTTLVVNASLTLENIPPEVQRYRLGNRSALEWIVDQYQVSEDARSGIRSDPNRLDDPEYIVRLVGQVVRVSVETVMIVEGLPKGIGVGMSVPPA